MAVAMHAVRRAAFEPVTPPIGSLTTIGVDGNGACGGGGPGGGVGWGERAPTCVSRVLPSLNATVANTDVSLGIGAAICRMVTGWLLVPYSAAAPRKSHGGGRSDADVSLVDVADVAVAVVPSVAALTCWPALA
jgi:hypothetical protein